MSTTAVAAVSSTDPVLTRLGCSPARWLLAPLPAAARAAAADVLDPGEVDVALAFGPVSPPGGTDPAVSLPAGLAAASAHRAAAALAGHLAAGGTGYLPALANPSLPARLRTARVDACLRDRTEGASQQALLANPATPLPQARALLRIGRGPLPVGLVRDLTDRFGGRVGRLLRRHGAHPASTGSAAPDQPHAPQATVRRALLDPPSAFGWGTGGVAAADLRRLLTTACWELAPARRHDGVQLHVLDALRLGRVDLPAQVTVTLLAQAYGLPRSFADWPVAAATVLAPPRTVAAALTPLGEDRGRFELLFALTSDWQGTVADLLATVRALKR